ncbi:prefoldin subunit 1-like [Ornithodoros turicata]
MAAPVDMELRKAFQELQVKMIDTTRRLKMADMQIDSLKNVIQGAYLTGEALSEAPADTKMFVSVGRMFIVSSSPDVKKTLDDKIKTNSEKIKNLETNKAYLERSLKESENNLREMIIQKQSMQ